MQILKAEKEGYQTVHTFENGDGWRVGLICYAERFTEAGMTYLERHRMTDEIFLRLKGNAVLILGEEKSRIVMEPGIAYNVPQSEWHHILLDEDAVVAVIENKNTSKENTEYLYI